MKIKTKQHTNLILKAFTLIFTLSTVIFIACWCVGEVDWNGFTELNINYNIFWTCLLIGAGFCCGIVAMWLFWKPSISLMIFRMSNPLILSYAMQAIIEKIEGEKWEKKFTEHWENYLRHKFNHIKYKKSACN